MIFEAIKSLCPNAKFGVRDNDYNQIDWWSDDIEKPTKEKIETEIARLEIQHVIDQQTKSDAKASALVKLKKLGLTEDEVKSLLG